MNALQDRIAKALQEHLDCRRISPLFSAFQGGFSQCFTCTTDKGKFFVKANKNGAMLAAEMQGLQAIQETKTLTVPTPYYLGQEQDISFIIMDYVDMLPHTPESQCQLGELLAKMHLQKHAKQFGYSIDTTIGTTPQINDYANDWVEFFVTHRLDYQLRLIESQYHDTEIRKQGEQFLKKFPDFFVDQNIFPSLLHGDLWRGNTCTDQGNRPIVYDPAVYYGHHEADLGILLMFGGFSSTFHQAYHEKIPRQPGFEERQWGYQLYHYLNHYHLFGSNYRPACLTILQNVN